MAPKKVVDSVDVYRESKRQTLTVAIGPDETFGELKAKLIQMLGITDEVMLRHHGHRTSDYDKLGSKSPIQLQELTKKTDISSNSTMDELMQHGAKDLMEYAVSNGIKVNKSAGKTEVAQAIRGCSTSSTSIIISIKKLSGEVEPVSVHAGTVINIADFLDPAPKPKEPKEQVQHKQSINKQSTNKQTGQ